MASANGVSIDVDLDAAQALIEAQNVADAIERIAEQVEELRRTQQEQADEFQAGLDATGASLQTLGREVIEITGLFEGAGEGVGNFIGALGEGNFAGVVTEGLGLIVELLDDIAHASEKAQEEYEKAMSHITKTSEKHRRDAAKGAISPTGIQGGGAATDEEYIAAAKPQIFGSGLVSWGASSVMSGVGSSWNPMNIASNALFGTDVGQMQRGVMKTIGKTGADREAQIRENQRKEETARKQREKDEEAARKERNKIRETAHKESATGAEKALKIQEKEKEKAADKARKDANAAEKKQETFDKQKASKVASAEKAIAGAAKSWGRREEMRKIRESGGKKAASVSMSTGYETLFNSMMKAGGLTAGGADKTRKQVQEEMLAKQLEWHKEDQLLKKEQLQAIKDSRPAVALGANPFNNG